MGKWIPSVNAHQLYSKPGSFTFLNQTHSFTRDIDWDYNELGLLWTYNLNYFEYLEQSGMEKETGYKLIDDFLHKYPKIKIAHDPYPISLRLIFWIRFFIRQNKQPAERYLIALHEQAKELKSKLEYHLLGNHLLENAYALFFTGSYLADERMIRQAGKLLHEQLKEQILPDGGHFELSPMYHQLMLYRLLDVINMARISSSGKPAALLPILEQKASIMLSWMQQMSFSDGSFPLFNDAAYGIAPRPVEIAAYAGRLDISPKTQPLNESGYRKWIGNNWEMILDAGIPGPSYQPGHAHCDALSFVLQVNDKPVLVDTGTSVYGGDSQRRKKEKGTAAHNTVQIGNLEQSEIWGDFRMARRANIRIMLDVPGKIEASHNGFYFKKEIHTRSFELKEQNIIEILDNIINSSESIHKARFHFYPGIVVNEIKDDLFDFGDGCFQFIHYNKITKFVYEYAPEFGKRVPAVGLEVSFGKKLISTIKLLLPTDKR